MKMNDPALRFSNPRLLAAVYFGLLSVVGTVLINGLLTVIGIEEIIPLFQAVLLGMLVASTTGAICGKSIIHCPKPYKVKVFLIGFWMVIVSLPIFALGLLFFMDDSDSRLFSLTAFQNLAYLYVLVLAYSYILFGIILAIGSGIAAIYLRNKLVYDILHTDRRRSQTLPNFVAARNKRKLATKTSVSKRKEI